MEIKISKDTLGLSPNLITFLEFKKRTGKDFIKVMSDLDKSKKEPDIDLILDLIFAGHSAFLKITTGQYLSSEQEINYISNWDLTNFFKSETQKQLGDFMKKLVDVKGLNQVG